MMLDLTPGFSWLHAPPDGSQPKPPVDVREQELPFSELSWENFERLILRLARRESEVIDVSLYGTPGQAQAGIDILATTSNQQNLRICYQCKRVREFGPANIKKAVDDFLEGKWAAKTEQFVLCTSIPLGSTQQQDELDHQRSRLVKKGVALSVWDSAPASELSERLKQLPDLVDDFFGRSWVERFNGKEVAAGLSVRLNGYELSFLRRRLLSLYSVIFSQHDPGLRTDSGHSVNYPQRYVLPDIAEWSETSFPDRAISEHAGGSTTKDVDMRRLGETSHTSSRSQLYEMRSPVLDWLLKKNDCVLLGEPGYGKSAFLRYLALSILQPDASSAENLDPALFSALPVWISFARLSSVVDKRAGLSIEDFFRSWLHQHSFDDVYPLFERAVQGSQIILLLDGLDEAASEASGREALDRVVTFLNSRSANIICTSRPQGYKSLGVPASWNHASLTPLSDEKIELLATRWFAILESDAEHENGAQQAYEVTDQIRRRAQGFLRAASDNQRTLELARTPLLCQALIQLYRYSHRLPEARVAAYQAIIDLLLSVHPVARAQAGGITQPAKLLGLKTADLKELLVRLAWGLQNEESHGGFSRDHCEQLCAEFLEDDTYGLGLHKVQARRSATDIVELLLNQYGLLIERAPDDISFVHLSIQEYLAAEWIARQPDEEQLRLLSDVWTSPNWRESLLSWFGVLDTPGKRLLSGEASKRISDLGQAGEWQKMQALELRTEIATSDLGLPVSEAREIVEQARCQVEESPFPEFRTKLARWIALGTLGSAVRSECLDAVRRWMPGRSPYTRLSLLQAFRTWAPSEALRSTLLRAIQDEDGRCRRAASETFASVFFESVDALPTLKAHASHHMQPEIRAAALHGLATRPEWESSAADLAAANVGSSNADLLLVVSKIRVIQGLQNDEDLERVWRLWRTDAVDFWFRDELVEILCTGWPKHAGVRSTFLRILNEGHRPSDVDLPLEYLMRCYPNDDEIADTLAKIFKLSGKHFSSESRRLWEPMRKGYRNHPVTTPALREMLAEYRKEFSAIFWHPNTVPAFGVLGDDEARDELLSSYETGDFRDRYWIAKTLLEAWPDDEVVLDKLRKWSANSIELAAPLARWGKHLVPDLDQRQAWLCQLVEESNSLREISAITELLKEFPCVFHAIRPPIPGLFGR